MLDYLPADQRATLERALVQLEAALHEAANELKGKPWPVIRSAVLQAIATGFGAFPTIAEKAIQARWSPDTARAAGIEYLQAHSARAYEFLLVNQIVRWGSPYHFGRYDSEDRFVFCRDMVEAIQTTKLWGEFLQTLASVTKSSVDVGQSATIRAISWSDIEIAFLSETRVQVITSDSTVTLNYAEMGFEDGRTQKPVKAWDTLRELAEGRGVLTVDHSGVGYVTQGKRIQEIRRILQRRFALSGNPVSLASGVYQARFKVTTRMAFDT